jgi:hypothetical protein
MADLKSSKPSLAKRLRRGSWAFRTPEGQLASAKVVGRWIRPLEARVAELEAEVQECRALNRRIAELTDVVTELLVPLAAGDTAAASEIAERYRLTL